MLTPSRPSWLSIAFELGGRIIWPAAPGSRIDRRLQALRLSDALLLPPAIAGSALLVPVLAFAFRDREHRAEEGSAIIGAAHR